MNELKVNNNSEDHQKAYQIARSLEKGERYTMFNSSGGLIFEFVDWCIMSHTMTYKVNGVEEIYYNMRPEQILTIQKVS
ncbi:MAG: hypothetical protein V4565_08990 [Bacteroidota bacterium]